MKRAADRKRTGFTLVEILVVIAIIAILASLITAGAMVVYRRMLDTSNANDINQLNISINTFKGKYKIYPPSKIRLINSQTWNGVGTPPITPPIAGTSTQSSTYNLAMNGSQPLNPLDFNSYQFITQIWPNLQWTNIDWSGGTSTAGDWTLEGDQCLVFFLGGIPSAGGPLGFSASPTNPTLLPGLPVIPNSSGTPPGRIAPFFDFKPNRLVQLHYAPTSSTTARWPDAAQTAHVPSPFCSYADAYAYIQTVNQVLTIPVNANGPAGTYLGQPFAYFATFRQSNQYNPYLNLNLFPNIPAGQFKSDCDGIGVMPYGKPSISTAGQFIPQYQNPDGFQIISAGVDQVFGSTTLTAALARPPGGANPYTPGPVIWNPAGANVTWNLNGSLLSPQVPDSALPSPIAGMDDRTNFCPNILSAGNAQ